MAIGRISGPMLQSNLERQGINLSVETDLLYFDVTNNRIGIRNAIPAYSLDVSGNGQIGNIVLDSGNISPLITSANLNLSGNGTGIVVVTGNLDAGNISTSNVVTSNVSTSTGNLTLDPVAGSNVVVTSNLNISSIEDASSTTTGALVITGGVGVGGNLYVSTALNVAGTDVIDAISAVSAQLASVDTKLSDAISANTDAISVLSAALASTNDVVSALSSDLASIDTKLSNAVSVVAADLSSAVSNLQSAIDTVSNTISIVLNSSTTFSGATYSFTGNTPSNTVSSGTVVITGGLGVSDNIYANVVTATSKLEAASLTITTDTLSNNNIDGNVVIQPNGTGILDINTDTAMLIPAGPESSRPLGATAGYTRYNTSSGYLEYYNGATWVNASPTTGLMSLDIYQGDNSTTTFTASQTVPVENYIVTLNGVMQLPGVAYTLSGADIIFAEAPTSIDTVEIRSLNTSLIGLGPTIQNEALDTIVTVENTVGDNKVRMTTSGTERIVLDSNLNLKSGTNLTYDQTGISAGTGNTIVDTFTTTSYRSAKYFVQVSNGSNHQVFDAMVVHNGTTPYISSSTLYTSSSLGTLGVDMVGGTVQLIFVGSGTGNTVKVHKTQLV
jgi:hypothetical protein